MANDSLTVDQCIECASISDVGMRRANNQDAFNTMVVSDREYWEQRGHLFVVADGMGAHAAGELASKLAADGIIHSYAKRLDRQPHEALQQAIVEANAKIHEKGQTDAGFQGMGTTCSAMLLMPQGAIIGHVGDSRAYRLRGGRLEQLTFDHSLVWEMEAAGHLGGNGTDLHLPKNIITRSLGPNRTVKVDLEGPFAVAVGDVFLLCSDGLTGPVRDEELGAVMASMPPDEAVQTLVDLANLRGGPDNITVIVVRVTSPPVATIKPDDEEDQKKRVQPVLLLVAAVCLIAAVAMWFADAKFKLPAILCGMGALVSAIVAILQRFDTGEEAIQDGPPPIPILGRGPHRTYDCTPNAEMVAEFTRIVEELTKTAGSVGLKFDQGHLGRLTGEAQAAVDRRDFHTAVRRYGEGISYIVAAMKQSGHGRKISDSTVDLL